MRSIFELSTSEVWHLLAEQLGEEVPPLDAVENEDWGRDYLLQRLLAQPPDRLAKVGIYIPSDLPSAPSPDSRTEREDK
jgi:hypothetical protein